MTIQIAVLIVICMGALGAVVWLSRSKAAAVKGLTDRAEQAEQAGQRSARDARQAREQTEEVQRWWDQQAKNRSEHAARALRHLVEVDLPAALNGEPVPAEGAAVPDEVTGVLFGQVLSLAADAARAGAEDRESIRVTVVGLSRRVQASAHRSQQVADEMARQHAQAPDVVEGCMRLDHMAAQQARHAASLAVLCGEVPGQQWTEALALVDVARAASGRIEPYSRVDVVGDQTVAVTPEAAEGLIHVLAEFLANAAQSSPPTSRVTVQVSMVQRGAVIEIDDRGPGVTEHELSQMRAVASGSVPRGLADLSEVPQTGLAVVGEYVRRLGLAADVQASVYGGLRAVVRVPETLVTVVAISTPAITATNGRDLGVRTEAVPVNGDRGRQGSGGLPTRRSRRDEAVSPALPPVPGTAEAAQEPPESPEAAGDWMNSYFTGGAPASGGAATDINDQKEI
ncbi:ATP-binding protein [Streptomyces sp. NPDC058409]|uniref:ATP-binding protein n=1 Tax=Streptomyces sp. NPDC058409 TaxID=3346484 RepID=UPI00364753F6